MRSVCNSPNTASDDNPIFIIGGSVDTSTGSWSRSLSDGTIIQGGYFPITSTASSNKMWNIPFMHNYTTEHVNVKAAPVFKASAPGQVTGGFNVGYVTTSDFSLVINGYVSRVIGCSWEATGI